MDEYDYTVADPDFLAFLQGQSLQEFLRPQSEISTLAFPPVRAVTTAASTSYVSDFIPDEPVPEDDFTLVPADELHPFIQERKQSQRQQAAPNTFHKQPGSDLFFPDGSPTDLAIAVAIYTSARRPNNVMSRFPLRVGNHVGAVCVAPLPPITEDDRAIQQTHNDSRVLEPLYVILDRTNIDPSLFCPLEYYGHPVLEARMDLGRYGYPHWSQFPVNKGIPFPQDAPPTSRPPHAWLPPYMMPLHPVMAYWGRNLSQRQDLPVLSAYNRGSMHVWPMFFCTTDGDQEDFGWGPGVRVHPWFEPSMTRAVAHLQEQVTSLSAAQNNRYEY
jgi:hypothetical protein